MIFADGKQVMLPYDDVIHLRRHYATNERLGNDNAPLYPLSDTAHTLTEATGAAVKNATNIRGILKFTSLVNPAQVKAEKEKFVSDYLNLSNAGGIAATDQRFEFVPTVQTGYNVPHEATDAINRQICAYLGISPKIAAGDYTENEFAAFYESVIAVSYTHLDVYKRQKHGRRDFLQLLSGKRGHDIGVNHRLIVNQNIGL